MSALALSVLLSFVSAVAYAGGAIVQEHVAMSSPGEEYAPLRRPGWWAAVALNGLGGLLHVVALAYGPLSLVQPLGALTIVFALPMAALFVGRRAGATAWRGAIMATVGLAGLLSLVGASDGHSLAVPERIAVAVVSGAGIVALMVAGRAAHRHPAVRSMLLATGSGVAFGMASVFTKTVAVDWTDGVATTDLPSLGLIAVFATAGMLLSQASYRGAGLAAPLATLTVVNPVVAAAVGITMFGETFRHGTTGTVLALGCGVVAAGGLILLTTERLQQTGADGPRTAPGTSIGGLPAQAGPGSPERTTPRETPPGEISPEAEPQAPVREPAKDPAPATATGTRNTEPVVTATGPQGPEPVVAAAGTQGTEPVVTVTGAQGPEPVVTVVEREASALVPVTTAAAAAATEAATEVSDAPDAGQRGGPGAPPFDDGAPGPLHYRFYGPFYGGAYVPLPAIDRHRVRVRS
ncbi:DMT family transporter [Streptomyces sp. NPDC096080]|uniref:DMT family transporter n=1 Tax=Streptomyces sp. NPDC096080 TaxID=3156693 RepID=UPI003328DD44